MNMHVPQSLQARAEVKGLYLFHHDPDQDDDAIDAKHAVARMMLEKRGSDIPCYCPAEAETVMV